MKRPETAAYVCVPKQSWARFFAALENALEDESWRRTMRDRERRRAELFFRIRRRRTVYADLLHVAVTRRFRMRTVWRNAFRPIFLVRPPLFLSPFPIE